MRTQILAVCTGVFLCASLFSAEVRGDNVTLLGHAGGTATGVAVSGQYAYATEMNGFNVLDVSTATAPVLRGHLLLPAGKDHGGHLATSGNFAYVPWSGGIFHKSIGKATTEGGFEIVDVSNSTAPRLASEDIEPGGVMGLAARNNILYVPYLQVDVNTYTFLGGFRIYDISNPVSPALLGECNTGASAGVVLDGNKAYVIGFGGFSIVDITNPAAPTILGSWPAGGLMSVTMDAVVSGSTVYLVQVKANDINSSIYSLATVNVTNPAAPATLGVCQLGSFSGLVVDVMGLALSGTRAFVSNNEMGLQIVDVSNTASPQLASTNLMGCETLGIALNGTTAYIASGAAGLDVVNMADPLNPAHLRYCLMGTPARTVIWNQHAYTCWMDSFNKGSVVRQSGGIRISALPGMGVVSAIDAPGAGVMAAPGGDRVSFSWTNYQTATNGIDVYDVHDAANPSLLTKLTGIGVSSLAAKNNYLFLTAGFDGSLWTIDLTDVAHPQNYNWGLWSYPMEHLQVEGQTLTGFSSGGATVFEIMVPTNPLPLYDASWGAGSFSDMKHQGNLTYLLEPTQLAIYGAVPTKPRQIFNWLGATSIALSGRLAYCACPTGVQVLDLINPLDPQMTTPLGSYRFDGLEATLNSENGIVYASDPNRGMFALRYSGVFPHVLGGTFAGQWTELCGIMGLSPDNADVNNDGLPESWALNLVATVLEHANAPMHESTCVAYMDNYMQLTGVSPNPVVWRNRECLAALILMGADIRDYMTGAVYLPDLTWSTTVVAGEPFNGSGDPDHDGMSNAAEAAAVAHRGGTADTFSEMALFRFGAGPVPLAGAAGLVTLFGLLAVAGARRMRRR